MADHWNVLLDPPPGGLPRLVSAIRSNAAPRRHRYALAMSAAAVLAIAIAVDRPDSSTQKLRQALKSALDERDQVHVENGVALELPTTRADVRLFVIAQIPPAAD